MKTHRKCRSHFIVLRHKVKKMAAVKYLECGRTDCPGCQREKADKYYREWMRWGMMAMYWKEVTDTEFESLSLKARRAGEYYWRCPVEAGNTILVTTYPGRKPCEVCGSSDWGGVFI